MPTALSPSVLESVTFCTYGDEGVLTFGAALPLSVARERARCVYVCVGSVLLWVQVQTRDYSRPSLVIPRVSGDRQFHHPHCKWKQHLSNVTVLRGRDHTAV
jgi:hypothetical protein